MARRTHARPIPAWVGDLPVFERILPNGLKALVLPRPESPIVVCDLYYPTGSAQDPPGKTGLAHFVEHMLFKGTEKYPRGQIDALTFLAGGQTNAETGEDFTHYWFTFPANRWEVAPAIEADRMKGIKFDPVDVVAERRVIAEERARDLDTPQGRFEQTHLELSYLVHPYRNPILGWGRDVLGLEADDLKQFHERFYQPNRAVFVVAGAVEPERALDRIEESLGDLKSNKIYSNDLVISESQQTGRREFRLHEAEEVGRGLFGWRSVPLRHPDLPGCDVLAGIVGVGWRARLWEELVEKRRLATWVEASSEPSRLAGQFVVQVEFAADVDPERIENALRGTINDLCRQGPTPIELSRSRARLEAAWRWEREDPAGLAAGLGPVALWNDWRTWQDEHKATLAVRAEEVQHAASTYLVDENLTVGWLLPRKDQTVFDFARAHLDENREPVDHGIQNPSYEKIHSFNINKLASIPLPGYEEAMEAPARLRDFKPLAATLRNGLRIVSERRSGAGVVAIELGLETGMLREDEPGVASLTAKLLEEGTVARSARQIAEAIEDIGGSLEISASRVSLRVRREDLEPAIEILADLVRRPAFPEEEVEWAKRRIINELRGDHEDPAYLADQLFLESVYQGHPYGRDPRGSARQVARLTLDHVHQHHARHYRPAGGILAAVGDFSTTTLRSLVRKYFNDWSNEHYVINPLPIPVRSRKGRRRRLARPGRQVQVVLGHLGIARDDPDHDALLILDHILGSGPGFNDRLSRILREEMGLVYHVGGSITDSADRIPGVFRVALATRPEDAARAMAVVIDQIKRMRDGEFSDDEVELARRYMASSWVFEYQTVGQRAERLFELDRCGLRLDDPIDWPERLARITAEGVRKAARKALDPSVLHRVELGPIGKKGRV